MVEKNKNNNRKVEGFDVRISNATLATLFECDHANVKCAKCLGLSYCEHDCRECFEDRHGKQLGLFKEGN